MPVRSGQDHQTATQIVPEWCANARPPDRPNAELTAKIQLPHMVHHGNFRAYDVKTARFYGKQYIAMASGNGEGTASAGDREPLWCTMRIPGASGLKGPRMIKSIPQLDIETASMTELAAAREQSWVARSRRGFEVLRYRQGLAVLDHPQFQKGASFRRRLDDLGITTGPIRELWNRMLVCNEGEVRERLRVPLGKLFGPAQMKRLQGQLREIIDRVLSEIENPDDVDFMHDIAWKIPSRVYCFLVSAPETFAPDAARLSDSIVGPILSSDHSRRQECIDAVLESYTLVEEHFDARRNSLGDDFTSVMIRQQLAGLLSRDELVLQGMSILQASIENTVNQLGLTFATLLERPDRWRALCANPELIPVAIEETIRLNPRFGTVFRLAATDLQLEDLTIPADSWVFVSVRAANRDESMFENANEYRLGRPRARALMFGGGPYNCLGQSLARLEISETLRAVMARFPNIRMRGGWNTKASNAVTEIATLRVAMEST
jgi:cytochrome P450